MAQGEPISLGRMPGFREESSLATSRAMGLPGLTGCPSMAAMSTPRPRGWVETERAVVDLGWAEPGQGGVGEGRTVLNWGWSEQVQEMVSLWSGLSLVSTATTRGSMRPALTSATP